MKLIEVERLLGGQRMIVYFVSDERVDFRELVKLLATDFQTRIEMKQIGVRRLREASLLQQSLGQDASCFDEDGKTAEGDVGPDENLRTLRATEVLLAVRV